MNTVTVSHWLITYCFISCPLPVPSFFFGLRCGIKFYNSCFPVPVPIALAETLINYPGGGGSNRAKFRKGMVDVKVFGYVEDGRDRLLEIEVSAVA